MRVRDNGETISWLLSARDTHQHADETGQWAYAHRTVRIDICKRTGKIVLLRINRQTPIATNPACDPIRVRRLLEWARVERLKRADPLFGAGRR